jgi:hypothetical protein
MEGLCGEIRCPNEKQDDEEGGDRAKAEPLHRLFFMKNIFSKSAAAVRGK